MKRIAILILLFPFVFARQSFGLDDIEARLKTLEATIKVQQNTIENQQQEISKEPRASARGIKNQILIV